MLKALYDYSIRNGLALPPGFVSRQIRAYILLSTNGEYLGIEQCDEVLPCPDIGSQTHGNKCNVLAEKASIVLFAQAEDVKTVQKNLFFKEALRSASEYDPSLKLCLALLENSSLLQVVRTEASSKKIQSNDRITFKIGFSPIVSSDAVISWWKTFRKQFLNESQNALCLITGNLATPLITTPTINGLTDVGGNSSGSSLISFDKSAFCSYDLKQAYNAPVSEDAFLAVKAALEDLLAGSPAMYKRDKNRAFNPAAPVFSGMKFVHWYDKSILPEDDLMLQDFAGFDTDDDEAYETDDGAAVQHFERQKAYTAKAAADRLVQSVHGEAQNSDLALPPDTLYHIMLVSGADGRVMVRLYETGRYETLQKNLTLWNADLALCNGLDTETLRPCKLSARLFFLLTRQKPPKDKKDRLKWHGKQRKRIKEELANLTPTIVMAIINGAPLPDVVASRALATIRSQMIEPDEDNPFFFMPNGRCCQWLKVWLLRRARARNEEVNLMPYYDPNFPNAAYHCGAIVAIYANLQHTATPEVKAGIVQRYYASASRTPTLVLGQLERLAKYHLAKLDSRYLTQIYENRLNEAYTFFRANGTDQLPAALNLEQQSYFALGYRQMSARLVADHNEAAARKKANTTEQEEA